MVILGMGALRKLSVSVGEFKRMYIRPKFRGKGFGKQLVNILLKDGRRFGCSSFTINDASLIFEASKVKIFARGPWIETLNFIYNL